VCASASRSPSERAARKRRPPPGGDPDLARDHDPVEQLGERRAVDVFEFRDVTWGIRIAGLFWEQSRYDFARPAHASSIKAGTAPVSR
jgi:hypothetical protein